jgi:hypothetical protein
VPCWYTTNQWLVCCLSLPQMSHDMAWRITGPSSSRRTAYFPFHRRLARLVKPAGKGIAGKNRSGRISMRCPETGTLG